MTLTTALTLSASLVVGGAIAGATPTSIEAPLELRVSSSIAPRELPRSAYAPVMAAIRGRIATSDDTHPSALREAEVNVEKNVKVNARNLPACHIGVIQLRSPAPGSACPGSRIGGGRAHIEIAYPEEAPLVVTSSLEVFNGGKSHGRTKLLIRASMPVPRPSAIVGRVTLQRVGSGLHSIVEIPTIAGGAGSLLDFKLELGRTYSYKGKKVGYFEAKCPTGAFDTSVKALFKNEANIPGVAATTALAGELSVPCTPTG